MSQGRALDWTEYFIRAAGPSWLSDHRAHQHVRAMGQQVSWGVEQEWSRRPLKNLESCFQPLVVRVYMHHRHPASMTCLGLELTRSWSSHCCEKSEVERTSCKRLFHHLGFLSTLLILLQLLFPLRLRLLGLPPLDAVLHTGNWAQRRNSEDQSQGGISPASPYSIAHGTDCSARSSAEKTSNNVVRRGRSCRLSGVDVNHENHETLTEMSERNGCNGRTAVVPESRLSSSSCAPGMKS